MNFKQLTKASFQFAKPTVCRDTDVHVVRISPVLSTEYFFLSLLLLLLLQLQFPQSFYAFRAFWIYFHFHLLLVYSALLRFFPFLLFFAQAALRMAEVGAESANVSINFAPFQHREASPDEERKKTLQLIEEYICSDSVTPVKHKMGLCDEQELCGGAISAEICRIF